jgi:hypothetical protein
LQGEAAQNEVAEVQLGRCVGCVRA